MLSDHNLAVPVAVPNRLETTPILLRKFALDVHRGLYQRPLWATITDGRWQVAVSARSQRLRSASPVAVAFARRAVAAGADTCRCGAWTMQRRPGKGCSCYVYAPMDVRYRRVSLQTRAMSLVLACSLSCGPSLPDDLPSLAELMNNNNMTISQDSARKVSRRYGKDGLLLVLDNGKPVARAKAAMFLRHHPDEAVEKALLKVIQNETDDFLRAHALCSLASVGTDAAIPVIAHVAPSPGSADSDYFRYCADEALTRINSRQKR